jgi:hypothetical protein
MKAISRIASPTLRWAPVGRRSYQLQGGEELAATLDWAAARGSLATGEAADGSWTFKRAGFLRPRVTVRVKGGRTDLALLHSIRSRESRLDFADGRRFAWGPTRARRREMAFFDPAGAVVVAFLIRVKLFKHYAEVEIGPDKRDLPELSLLALLGWYRLVLQIEEEAALAASAALSGG